MKNRKGFTTVELVIVIAVIAILATVMIPTFSSIIKKANISADEQVAYSMSTQLRLWGDIKNEYDLYQAIEEYYGEDYKQALSPRSAKYGYHYWYDYNNSMIVLRSTAELRGNGIGLAFNRNLANQVNMSAPVVVNYSNKHFAVPLDSTTGETVVFSPDSFRSGLIDGYYLLDTDGSELAKDIVRLETATNSLFATAVANLLANEYEDENDKFLAEEILKKLACTIIINENGMFSYDNNTANTALYVPVGTEKLGAGSCLYGSTEPNITLTDITAIYLPDGVAVSTDALFGFKNDNTDPNDVNAWKKPGATTIYVNAEEDELKDIFAAESTNCVIQLPTGERYIISGSSICKLTPNGPEEAGDAGGYTEIVDEITVTVDDGLNDTLKATIVNNTLYIAWDFTGDITINVEAYSVKDDNGGEPERTLISNPGRIMLNITGSGMSAEGSKVKISEQNAGDGTLTVSVQGVDYEFNVVNVGIESVTVTDIGGGGKDYDGVDGTNFVYVYELPYTETNNTMAVVATVKVEGSTLDEPAKSPYVDVDTTLDSFDGTNVSFAGNTLTINKTKGNYQETVKFSCGGVSSLDCILNLVDNTNSPFKIADKANTQSKYGVTYCIGTQGASVLLSDLFALNDGVTIDNQVVTYQFNQNGWSTAPVKAENWTSTAVNLSKAENDMENLTITISVGGASMSITVDLKYDAYNVKNASAATDWVSGAKNSVCILEDIELNDNKRVENIYGNLHVIDASGFSENSKTDFKDNYWPAYIMLNGSMDNTVLRGPVYSSVSFVNSSSAWDGVQMNGTAVISNSYLFGFRAPVAPYSGNLRISNSVIEGGTYCNIFCAAFTELTLENVTTIQDPNGYVAGRSTVCGVGIFYDTAFGGTVKLLGNTTQYNWLTKDLAKTYAGLLSGITGDLTGSVYNEIASAGNTHSFNNDTYFNTGVIQELDQKNGSLDATSENGYTGIGYTSKMSITVRVGFSFLGYDKYYSAWTYSSNGCTCANHKLRPSGWSNSTTRMGSGHYIYEDYLADRSLDPND